MFFTKDTSQREMSELKLGVGVHHIASEQIVHVSYATQVPIGNVDTVTVVAVFVRLRVRVSRAAVLQHSLYFPIVVERREAGPSMVPVGCTLIYV